MRFGEDFDAKDDVVDINRKSAGERIGKDDEDVRIVRIEIIRIRKCCNIVDDVCDWVMFEQRLNNVNNK